MTERGRARVPDGPDRRWLSGRASGTAPEEGMALLGLALDRTKRWGTTARALRAPGLDQVDVERRLYQLLDAGLIEIHERRNRRGDFIPYEWRLTPLGRELAEATRREDHIDGRMASFIREVAPKGNHPVLKTILEWLPANGRDNDRAARILMAIGEALLIGRWPTERAISLAAFGRTKAVRLSEYPEVVAHALGFPPDQVVRRAGQSVCGYGPFSFSIRGRRIDGEWSLPWLALTGETMDAMTDLRTDAKSLLTIENLTAFEEEVRAGLLPGVVALYTGGFPGALEMRMLDALIAAGIGAIDHWGDLDLGGLRIFRYLKETLPVPVNPFRMTPDLLEILPTSPLTEGDRRGLMAWMADDDAPLKALAAAMLDQNRKAEQEGWFLKTR